MKITPLTLVNIVCTSQTFKLISSFSLSVIPSWRSTHRSNGGSSTSSSRNSWSLYASCSSISRPSARLASAWAAWSSTSLFLAFGMLNCLIMALAVMFSICRKHLVWLGVPGKSSRRMLSWLIMVSLLDALSVVTPKILKRWVPAIVNNKLPWPCHQRQNLLRPWWMQVQDSNPCVTWGLWQGQGAWQVVCHSARSVPWWQCMLCDLVRSKRPSWSSISRHVPIIRWVLEAHFVQLTYLWHAGNPFANMNEGILHIAWQGLRWWDMIVGPLCLHQGAESTVFYDLKRPLTLCDPTYKLSTDNLHFRLSTLHPSKENSPHFDFGVLMMTVSDAPLGCTLKQCCDWHVNTFRICQHVSGSFDVPSVVSCSHSLLTPTDFSMSMEIASRLHIACVKEPANEPALAVAASGGTLKHMCPMMINILNRWRWLEEHVNWCVPVLAQLDWD